MTNIAFSSNVFGHFGRVEALRRIHELGFSLIDLWSSPVLANHVEPKTDDPSRVRAELDQYGITPVCMSIFYALHDEKIARFRMAAQLGIPFVSFTGAPTADYHEKMTGMDVVGRTLTEPGAGWETFTKVLLDLLDRAQDFGMRIALQAPHVYTLVETADDLRRLRDAVDHPALYFALSPTHAIARGSIVEELIAICSDRLAVLHLWNVKPDYQAGRDDRRWGTPAEQLAIKGYFDFEPLVADMARRDLPYLCLKCHGTESWTDADLISRTVRKATAGLEAATAGYPSDQISANAVTPDLETGG
jgi:sugar phosphate isomerase/epimerase